MNVGNRAEPLPPAWAFIDVARDYRWAAETLLENLLGIPEPHPSFIRRPSLSFLLNHVVELSLKAAIEAYGARAGHGHNVKSLYAKALLLGFSVPKDSDQVSRNANCIEAFHTQNSKHEFRYFDGKNGNCLDALALRPFANDVFRAAENAVAANVPRPLAKRMIDFVWPFVVRHPR